MPAADVPRWFWTGLLAALIGIGGTFKFAQNACEKRLVVGAPAFPSWETSSTALIPMFSYVGPAMSVSKVEGINGYVATCAISEGSGIMLRWSRLLEGPWSQPTLVTKLPGRIPQSKIISAQNHPEMAIQSGQLAVSYAQKLPPCPSKDKSELSAGCLRYVLIDIWKQSRHK